MKLIVFHFIQGEIKATGFNDAVDKFYELLEVNKVCQNFWRNDVPGKICSHVKLEFSLYSMNK